jgi:hypothetical protein
MFVPVTTAKVIVKESRYYGRPARKLVLSVPDVTNDSNFKELKFLHRLLFVLYTFWRLRP